MLCLDQNEEPDAFADVVMRRMKGGGMIAGQWMRMTEYTHMHISGKANITAVEPSRLIAADRTDMARDFSDSS